jgi:hypothetical protein
VRWLFTSEEAHSLGLSESALRWGARCGRWCRVERGVYAEGGEAPSALDAARARVIAGKGAARGRLAGVLHELDGVALDGSARGGERPAAGLLSRSMAFFVSTGSRR